MIVCAVETCIDRRMPARAFPTGSKFVHNAERSRELLNTSEDKENDKSGTTAKVL